MDTWVIVLLVVVGVLALLFIGGLLGNARVRREREGALAQRIAEADHHLADARAQDRGWDPALLETAARTAFAARVPGVEPSSLDLINTFLKRQPRLTRPAMLPPAAETQADLSVRSTRTEADLASESLARILVRQGKTERAIEIYRRLMVKQPEKLAYFASQIQQLQPPA